MSIVLYENYFKQRKYLTTITKQLGFTIVKRNTQYTQCFWCLFKYKQNKCIGLINLNKLGKITKLNFIYYFIL